MDFNVTPFTLAWEITRACALACVHCRAQAQPRRDPRELSTEEAYRVVDQVVDLGKPILIITGGDPLMRRDVFDILAYASSRGLRVALSPSATALVTPRNLARAKGAGVQMVHISLDGSRPEVQDVFRGVRGSYQRTVDILQHVRELGMPLQVGTTVSRYNRADLPAIAERVAAAGARVWSVFFLVPTGRGKAEDMVSPEEHEALFNWLYELSRTVPFAVRTTAAPHYRRVVIQRTRQQLAQEGKPSGDSVQWELTGAGYAFREGRAPREQGVNDGKGFCFISHTGDICPSGFLQLAGGNVRQQPLAEVYRRSPLFMALRNPDLLKGRCGACEFRNVCGGSRARAYALTGDYLASDPSCVYVPAALRSPSAV
ncbi:MAG: TIGR04053 family radical SAM/SPASM domain-containing protein [Chloroflexi bacterium]|nr:TIGR04053 family radical SAM/SPASM domain-containing protein [Chloroflexota bacterium]